MRLSLRLIFRRSCLNFINVRTAYASKIQAPPTKNHLANSGTTRFREHIMMYFRNLILCIWPAADFPSEAGFQVPIMLYGNPVFQC